MQILTLQDLKSRGAQSIPDDRVVYLIVNSRTKSVLVPPAEYELLMRALEDLEDRSAIEARRGEKTVPFDRVFPQKKA